LSEQSNYVTIIRYEKCPHERGEDTHGAKGVSIMASHEDGRGRQDVLEGGLRDECVHQKMMKDAAWDASTWEPRDVP
jgi:hypothetical protein